MKVVLSAGDAGLAEGLRSAGFEVEVAEDRAAARRLVGPDDRMLVDAEAAQMALALEPAEMQALLRQVRHDLRSPMQAQALLVGFLREDLSGAPNREQTAQYLETLAHSSRQIAALADGLMEFWRAHLQPMTEEVVSLRQVMADVEAELARDLDDATLEKGALLDVRGDHQLLCRLLLQLVSNALRFRQPGYPPHVRVSSRRRGDRVELTVSDDGIGIEPRFFEEIFTPLRRLHGRKAYPGSGFGLAAARAVARRHGGDVEVASVPGQGSTFTVDLPAAPGQVE